MEIPLEALRRSGLSPEAKVQELMTMIRKFPLHSDVAKRLTLEIAEMNDMAGSGAHGGDVVERESVELAM